MPFWCLRGSPSHNCQAGFGTSNPFICRDRNEIFLVGSREPTLWEKAFCKSAQDPPPPPSTCLVSCDRLTALISSFLLRKWRTFMEKHFMLQTRLLALGGSGAPAMGQRETLLLWCLWKGWVCLPVCRGKAPRFQCLLGSLVGISVGFGRSEFPEMLCGLFS